MKFQAEQVVWPPPPLEHLLPEESPFFAAPAIAQYYTSISTTLLGSENRPGVASVVCLPSFQPEWALRLVNFGKSGFRLLLNEAASSIWYCPDRASVAVEVREASVDSELSDAIRAVWNKMLSLTRHRKHGGVGLDGINYHFTFMSEARGWLAGKIWSPEEGTSPGKLVSLSHALRSFVRASASEQEGVLMEIRDRIAWFETMGKPGDSANS